MDVEQFGYFSQVLITFALFQNSVRKTKTVKGMELEKSLLSPSRNRHPVENIPQNNTDNFTVSEVEDNSFAIILPILETRMNPFYLINLY